MSNDICLYIQNNKTSPVFIILYVNDLVISREYIVDFNKVKMLFSCKSEMKDSTKQLKNQYKIIVTTPTSSS